MITSNIHIFHFAGIALLLKFLVSYKKPIPSHEVKKQPMVQFTELYDGGNQPNNLQYVMNKNLKQNPWSTIEMA